MKIKTLFLISMAIVMAACSKDESIDTPPSTETPSTPALAGLNIKDAKYIYRVENNTKSSSFQYRQIKKDGTDTILGWITEQGDTIAVTDDCSICDINERYLWFQTDSILKLQGDKPIYDENGNEMPSYSNPGSPTYLIDKKTETIFPIKEVEREQCIVYWGIWTSTTFVDNERNIFVIDYMTRALFKIHTQDPSNLKLEKYIDFTKIRTQDYGYSYRLSKRGTCFACCRYFRLPATPRLYALNEFVEGVMYGSAFLSSDGNDMYIATLNKTEGQADSPELNCVIYKVMDTENSVQLERVAHKCLGTPDSYALEVPGARPNPYKKNSILITTNKYGDYDLEFNLNDYSLSEYEPEEIIKELETYPYRTATAAFNQESINKISIISLRDFSKKTVDLVPLNIDLHNIWTEDRSEYLHFTGYRYTDSKSVTGTVDENGNVEITEELLSSLTGTITELIPIK